MKKFEVVIIGAGPAGLSAAKVLTEGGKKVLVLEKNQEIGPKICAGGLTFKDFDLGIPIQIAERVFYSIKINYLGKTIEVKRDSRPLVATIGREKLSQWQIQQIKKGLEIRTNSEVMEIKNNSVLLKDNQEIEFDYLIGADGSLSLVRRHLNLSTKNTLLTIQYLIPKKLSDLEVFFDKKLFGSGYAWVFPHENYTAVGCGIESKSQKANKLLANFHQWLKEKGIDFKNADLQTFPVNYDYQGFEFGNKFLIGDAAGFASGLTGEGIYFAIVSGQEIARKVLDPNYNFSKLKKVLKIKIGQEKIGKHLIFGILKSRSLTRFVFKNFI